MAEAMDPGASGNVFETIDPKLNMFALANGMDLLKETGSRRLVWFMGGLERGLAITSGAPESFNVNASAWPTKSPAEARSAHVADAVPGAELTATLERGIEVANGL